MRTRTLRYILLVLIAMLSWLQGTNAQSVESPYYVKTGDTIKDLTFHDVVNSETKTVSIRDFRGKWLILDFWSRWCGGCIYSFPKMDTLSKQFKDKVKMIMVGCVADKGEGEESELSIAKKLFGRVAKLNKLSITTTFDLGLSPKFDIGGLPHIIVIDPTGKVVMKTISVDKAMITALLEGKVPPYDRSYNEHEKAPSDDYNQHLPLLTNGNQTTGGIDTGFMYRSLFTRWNERMPGYIYSGFFARTPKADTRVSEFFAMDLQSIFHFIYTGIFEYGSTDTLRRETYPHVFNESKRSETLPLLRKGNSNLYSYSISLPDRLLTQEHVKAYLSQDIERTLGLTSRLEYREVPVLNLVVFDQRKIKRSRLPPTQKARIKKRIDGYDMENIDLRRLMEYHIADQVQGAYHTGHRLFPPIFDKTGINFNLDIQWKKLNYLNMSQLTRELRKLGFDLQEDRKRMKCIVVKDQYQ